MTDETRQPAEPEDPQARYNVTVKPDEQPTEPAPGQTTLEQTETTTEATVEPTETGTSSEDVRNAESQLPHR